MTSYTSVKKLTPSRYPVVLISLQKRRLFHRALQYNDLIFHH
mgnify:CR=1 FL=1